MQVGKFPPISSSNPIGSPQLRLESKRQGAVNDGPHHLLPPPLSFPCFTTPQAPPSPISLSRAIGKPGPSATNDFEAGCGAAYYQATGEAASAAEIRSALDLFGSARTIRRLAACGPHPYRRT